MLFQILVSVLDKFTNDMKVGDTKSAVRKVSDQERCRFRVFVILEYLLF